MLNTGTLIGDRYEILNKVGTGGMSDVYKAKDHKLNRFVAVKILKEEFSSDDNFVNKFKVEAQSAAGLMHSNIVNVYDVGAEKGIYYIVMELVEGITLKDYIEKKARLSIKEAVSIAIQIAMGMEAAHNNRIIHRDIKPQNIIISKDGKVKVTDFGIARAASSNTITSNAMGSVHYTSPEQARGGYSDEKSDIYSLGVTIFEMLTGRVPYNGETTVAIAIKHIQEEFPSARDYIDEIPVSVEQIIFKCTQKNPDRRYVSASELLVDLKRSLITPDEDFVKIIPLGGNAETKAISAEDINSIKKQTGRMNFSEEILAHTKAAVYVGDDAEGDEYYEDDEYYEEDEDDNDNDEIDDNYDEYSDDDDEYEDIDPKMARLMNIMTIIAAVIIVCIALFLVGKLVGVFNISPSTGTSTEQPEESEETEGVPMIQVVGLKLDEAKSMLTTKGLLISETYEESDDVETGIVIKQDIEEGKTVALQTTVNLVVSSGKKGINVPPVVGKSEAEARVTLEGEGFRMVRDVAESDTVEKGNVISQTPDGGSTAPKGSEITVVISSGKATKSVMVPDLRNMDEATAKATLTSLGLTWATINEESSATILPGLVISQSYSPGLAVDTGTSIDFTVSVGPKLDTYRCNYSVNAPEDYAGGSVQIVLNTNTGVSLYNTTTSSFPVAININGIIGSEAGIIVLNYTANVTTQVQQPDGSITTQVNQEPRTAQYEVPFTKE